MRIPFTSIVSFFKITAASWKDEIGKHKLEVFNAEVFARASTPPWNQTLEGFTYIVSYTLWVFVLQYCPPYFTFKLKTDTRTCETIACW